MLNGDFFWELRTLVDCGMFILIWMVQLIVYPSFCHISDEVLHSWHRTYTQRIGYFVMPMMLTQLILSLLACIYTMTALTALDLGLVVATWVLTAWLSVPLHKALAAGSVDPVSADLSCEQICPERCCGRLFFSWEF